MKYKNQGYLASIHSSSSLPPYFFFGGGGQVVDFIYLFEINTLRVLNCSKVTVKGFYFKQIIVFCYFNLLFWTFY